MRDEAEGSALRHGEGLEVAAMSRWLWWLGPPLVAIALVLLFEQRPLAIEIASWIPAYAGMTTLVAGMTRDDRNSL